ncbi:DUF4259 domain-containing protein [Streptomyces erythrochromogenes]|uniref:DUF4259 domain-containing protein n=1 Tax=Streptomyces erythrochromogenes TaxID=285574 RepID=UPI0036FA344C
MGTWGTGPFDNDTAADFADALDDAEPGAREALVRGVLVRTIDATGYLWEADEAVAAAALVAVQCPGGVALGTPCGPKASMPPFSADLRALADEALSRIADNEDADGPASNWFDPADEKQWRATLARLRAVLYPPPSLALFELHPPGN